MGRVDIFVKAVILPTRAQAICFFIISYESQCDIGYGLGVLALVLSPLQTFLGHRGRGSVAPDDLKRFFAFFSQKKRKA